MGSIDRGTDVTRWRMLALLLSWAMVAVTFQAAHATGSTFRTDSVERAEADTAARARGHVIVYASPFPKIQSVDDARRDTPGASPAFHRFVGRLGTRAVMESPGSCTPYAGTWVAAYHTRGYATGGYGPGCDGGVEVWRLSSGKWHTIAGPTQDAFRCRRLKTNGVPSSVFRPNGAYCVTRTGDVVLYHHK